MAKTEKRARSDVPECDGCWKTGPDVHFRDCGLFVCDKCWREDLSAASRLPGMVPESLVRSTTSAMTVRDVFAQFSERAPCPFCGNPLSFAPSQVDGDGSSVTCPCGAHGPIGDDKEKAVDLWNERANVR